MQEQMNHEESQTDPSCERKFEEEAETQESMFETILRIERERRESQKKPNHLKRKRTSFGEGSDSEVQDFLRGEVQGCDYDTEKTLGTHDTAESSEEPDYNTAESPEVTDYDIESEETQHIITREYCWMCGAQDNLEGCLVCGRALCSECIDIHQERCQEKAILGKNKGKGKKKKNTEEEMWKEEQ